MINTTSECFKPEKKYKTLFMLNLTEHEIIYIITLINVKFIMLMSVKMPTTVGILTFISKINITSECFN